MATTAPGSLDGVLAAVAWLPFVPDPARRRFDPVVLQQDVVRLRRFYRRQGFLAAQVDYAVKTDQNRHRVRVTILVEEGMPLRLRSVKVVAPDSSQIGTGAMRAEIRAGWQKIEKRNIGQRFSEQRITSLQSGLEKHLADRGYARATIEPRAAIDSIAGRVDMVWVVDTGARARVSAIQVEGLTRVSPRIVTRQLGFRAGDWTSRSALERARANVLSVDLFRTARLDLEKGAPGDTALPVRVAVKEDRPRFTSAEAGYATDGAGVSGQVRWTHPNFTGDARSLNAIALVQTGLWATSEIKDKLVRTTLVLNQPYVWAPALSLGFGPSFEARDGYIDRSAAWSLQSTLVWRFNPLQSAALRYEFTHRVVDTPRSVTVSSGTQTRSVLRTLGLDALADSLSQPLETSLFNLSTSLGGLDDIARPQRGIVLKPNLSVTAPPAWGTVEFGRADLQATAFAPLPGRSNAVMFRGNIGGLWPFGQSIPPEGESGTVEMVRLRDFLLTAGGASDVRGYSTRLLGPKLPRIEATVSGADTFLTADHYVEVGGLRRWTASVELRLGLPRISRDVFAHVFGDAGRVWTSDSRFAIRGIPDDDLEVHFTTGGGVGYYTPVGAIRFDVGYKLNPSVFDLRKPQDVVDALRAGRKPETAPVDHWRRYGFHLALGLYF